MFQVNQVNSETVIIETKSPLLRSANSHYHLHYSSYIPSPLKIEDVGKMLLSNKKAHLLKVICSKCIPITENLLTYKALSLVTPSFDYAFLIIL